MPTVLADTHRTESRMAKSNRRRRDNNTIANRRLPPTNYKLSRDDARRQLSFDFFRDMRPIEDRRTWHPEGPARPARSFRQARHRLVWTNPVRKSLPNFSSDPVNVFRSLWRSVPYAIGFENPDSVLVCARRRIREQVLHAFRKTGRRGQKKPRFSFYSKISCKRRK